jgi:transcriptional regulator with XRE-family HTH domain
MASNVVPGDVGKICRALHNSGMIKERIIPQRARTYLKEWRRHRDMSLDKVIDRLELEVGFPFSKGQLSRVERGEQPYNQDLLEALAKVYGCDSGDLIKRDPADPELIWDLYDKMTATQRVQAAEVIKALMKVS